MTRPPTLRLTHPAVITAFLMVQTLAAVFFLGDVVTELFTDPLGPHVVLEGLTALALISGMAFGTLTLRAALDRLRTQSAALAVAAGSLAQVIDTQFTDWRLTPAERDVGLLALKGLDVAEIAAVRGAATGTVRAQLAHIYAKTGVSGRAQFAAFFVEDLLGSGVPAIGAGPSATSS